MLTKKEKLILDLIITSIFSLTIFVIPIYMFDILPTPKNLILTYIATFITTFIIIRKLS